MLLHEVIQVILVLVNALQEVCSLKLQPVQLLIHLVGEKTTVEMWVGKEQQGADEEQWGGGSPVGVSGE